MDFKQYERDCLLAAKALIDKHYHTHITIPDLAKKVGLSSTRLKDGLKREFGINPYTYQLHLRMEIAKKILVETELSLKDIARMVGYKSASSFIAAFKRECKLTPTKYRKDA